MGVPAPANGTAGVDVASVNQTTSYANNSTSTAIELFGWFNYLVSGTFNGTLALQRTFDNGATWVNVTKDAWGATTLVNGTGATAVSTQFVEIEHGVQYQVNATITNGTAISRISQGSFVPKVGIDWMR